MVTLCEQVSSGIWEVLCVDCLQSIGTMSYDTLRASIRHNTQRGGIKCPKCRETSCRRCGLQLDGIEGDRGDDKLCKLCGLEVRHLGVALLV